MKSRYKLLLVCFVIGVNASLQAELSTKEKVAIATVASVVEKNKADTTKVKGEEQEKLATIDVTGAESELKQNIELHMPVTIPTCNADRGEVKQFFNTVKKNLRKASRALGYYNAELRSGGKIVDGCWKLRLRVTPGNVTKISSQEIKVIGEGAKD